MKENTERVTISARLMQIMADRDLRQVDLLNMVKPYCEKYGVKLTKSALSQFISGRNEPKQDKIFILAQALGVDMGWLMGYDVPMNLPDRQPPASDEKQNEIIRRSGQLTDQQKDAILLVMKSYTE